MVSKNLSYLTPIEVDEIMHTLKRPTMITAFD